MKWKTGFTKKFSCRLPIMGAPMLGPSGGRLAAETCRAGGLGFLAAGHLNSKESLKSLEQEIAIFKEVSMENDFPLCIGFIGHSTFATEEGWSLFENVLEDYSPMAIQIFAPAIAYMKNGTRRSVVQLAHSYGCKVIAQVGCEDDGVQALEEGVDCLIAQGTEAGGHGVRREHGCGTLSLTSRLVKRSQGKIPILSAGGIVDGSGLVAALSLGADGVVLGTRLWASDEAKGPAAYKKAMVDAKSADQVVRTEAFDVIWNSYRGTKWPAPFDSSGVLRNKITEKWDDKIAELRKEVERGENSKLVKEFMASTANEDPNFSCVFSGKGVASINSIEPAYDIIINIEKEAIASLNRLNSMNIDKNLIVAMLLVLSRCRIPGRKASRLASSLVSYDDYGKDNFSGKVADTYLKKHGASKELLNTANWTVVDPDTVANAVFDWAMDRGANVFSHWFQPLAGSGVRFGMTGQVQNTMMAFDANNQVIQGFSGKDLVRGVVDGSFLPTGGLLNSQNANGLLAIDTSSPIFCRGDVIFIPAVFASKDGEALDEKLPLLRSKNALSAAAMKLLPFIGIDGSSGLETYLEIEQEFYLVPRVQYYRRPDLQTTGRTLMGKAGPQKQEIANHYIAALSSATSALACLQEIQDESWSLGIPLKTRHREAGPNQFKLSCASGKCTTRIDQNLMVMQIIEEIAAKHGLAALLHEKPFNGIKGSSKNIHWSLQTREGLSLLNPNAVLEAAGNEDAFPLIMAAIMSGLAEYGDLVRISTSSPGNELRLKEYGPITVYNCLGENLAGSLQAYVKNGAATYGPNSTVVDLGVGEVLPFEVPSMDRNNDSLLQYSANGFALRGVGSGQNLSMSNTVLNSIIARKFSEFADRIEAGETTSEVAQKELNLIFEKGDILGGSQTSHLEAIEGLSAKKNMSLLEDMKVFTKEELAAHQNVLFEHYADIVEMEAMVMVDVIHQRVLPSMEASGYASLSEMKSVLESLEAAIQRIKEVPSAKEKANLAKELRSGEMITARSICDQAESTIPSDKWSLAAYKELQSLDSHTVTEPDYFGEI